MENRHDILLVEDDNINAFVMSDYYADTFVLHHVKTGSAALTFPYANKVKAVVMDINLGNENMDGIKTMQLMRITESYSQNPKYLAVTGYAMQGDEIHFLEKGFDAYVSKPIDFEKLKNLLIDLIS